MMISKSGEIMRTQTRPDGSFLTEQQFEIALSNRAKYPIFYNISDDFSTYPEAVLYLVQGGRGTGKTYSSLLDMLINGTKFIYMKRTKRDVNLLCGHGNGKKGFSSGTDTADLSPFKSINRDVGTNIRAVSLFDGMGGFYLCNEDNEPVGDPIAYIISFSMIGQIRGFDLSDCDFIIFDEFVPKKYERQNRYEGQELLDFYLTVERANNLIYNKVLKIVLLSNSDTVSCPITTELDLIDTLADMQAHGEEIKYIKDREILLHRIPDIEGFREAALKNPIYKVAKGTKWKDMSLDNDYAYDDFSNVKKMSLKGMRCLFRVHYHNKWYYCYVGDKGYYMTYTKSTSYDFSYDLDRENDQRLFYYDQVLILRDECMEGRVAFETFQMYDLISKYKSIFTIA